MAVAANVTQSAFCRLDEVLLTFGALTMEYQDLRDTRGGDRIACTAILDSLEKRWANADQNVLIAAVILNPFFKHSPFKALSRFQPANIYNLFVILWNRFFPGQHSPLTLYQNVIDYLREKGDFMTLQATVKVCLDMSEGKVMCIYILQVSINTHNHYRMSRRTHGCCSTRSKSSDAHRKKRCQ